MEDQDPTIPFNTGTQALVRFATILGAKLFLPRVLPLISQALNTPDWRYRAAGATAIAYVAEGIQGPFSEQLPSVLPSLLGALTSDPHPRVKYSAMSAIARLSVVFGGDFQNQFTDEIIPVVISAFNNTEHQRLLKQYLLGLVDFINRAELSTMSPHLNDILERVNSFCSAQDVQIQTAAFSLVATIANLCENGEFAPFYGTFINGLVTVLQADASSVDLKKRRDKAVECLGMSRFYLISRAIFLDLTYTLINLLLCLCLCLCRLPHVGNVNLSGSILLNMIQ